MPFTPDHSANFPQRFYPCPECGDRGVYEIRPSRTSDGRMASAQALRCKYCGWVAAGYAPHHLYDEKGALS